MPGYGFMTFSPPPIDDVGDVDSDHDKRRDDNTSHLLEIPRDPNIPSIESVENIFSSLAYTVISQTYDLDPDAMDMGWSPPPSGSQAFVALEDIAPTPALSTSYSTDSMSSYESPGDTCLSAPSLSSELCDLSDSDFLIPGCTSNSAHHHQPLCVSPSDTLLNSKSPLPTWLLHQDSSLHGQGSDRSEPVELQHLQISAPANLPSSSFSSFVAVPARTDLPSNPQVFGYTSTSVVPNPPSSIHLDSDYSLNTVPMTSPAPPIPSEDKLRSRKPKKFWCSECGDGFTEKKNLTAHMRGPKHNIDFKPHQCPHCPCSYNRANGLKDHMQKHHSDVVKKHVHYEPIVTYAPFAGLRRPHLETTRICVSTVAGWIARGLAILRLIKTRIKTFPVHVDLTLILQSPSTPFRAPQRGLGRQEDEHREDKDEDDRHGPWILALMSRRMTSSRAVHPATVLTQMRVALIPLNADHDHERFRVLCVRTDQLLPAHSPSPSPSARFISPSPLISHHLTPADIIHSSLPLRQLLSSARPLVFRDSITVALTLPLNLTHPTEYAKTDGLPGLNSSSDVQHV
ncbi:hypothetical protein C8Q80DRAFT_1357742 [Daedaleopsis nitida]|nr:hypothetical protein C8Q80DRAFT_1357742 [Daedaleopsis nitida]